MKKLLYTALALTALVGCNKNEDFNPVTDDNAVKFGAEIVATRASGTTWANNDAVGIYMLDNTTKNVLNNNVQYKATAAGASVDFTPVTSSETIYYPVSGNVDFVAYYPYQTPLTSNSYAINVADQTDLPAIDLMRSRLDNQTKSRAGHNFTFTHQLSNVVLTIASGKGVTNADLAGLKVTLKDINTIAPFDVLAGTIGSQSDSKDVVFLTANNGLSSEAILLPGDISGKVMEFEIATGALAGLKFESTFPTTTLVATKKHTYNVTIDREAVTFSGATITDWGNGGSTDLNGGEVMPKEYITVNGIKVAVGNLVADGANGCKIGAPEDGGLYFQFGSLVGWAGGATGDGTGRGTDNTTPALSVQVKPASCTKSDNTWYNDNGTNKDQLDKFYFNYSVSPYETTGTDIRGFKKGENGVTIESVPAGKTLGEGGYAHLGVGDPCSYYLGGKWRLPTKEEWKTIMGVSTEGDWSSAPGWSVNAGTFISGSTTSYATHTASGLTIPASGFRDYRNGSFLNVGQNGYYWSSSVNSATRGYSQSFGNILVITQNVSDRSYGFPVRCIHE